MLILGAQVLLGFQYRSVFEPGFDKLPHASQYLKLGGLGLMLIATALLMSPGSFHRIVAEGEDTEEVNRFTTRVMGWALLPFAVGLGIDLFVATERLAGPAYSIIAGGAATITALFFWYGLEAIRRTKREPEIKEKQEMEERDEKSESSDGAKLKDKIEHVLTEGRMVLPGAQALLGFQFATMFMEGFEKLPASSKYVHLASLMLITLSIIFLMTPAAYHRLVEKGQDTEHFHRFASRMLLVSMIPLALGICGDLFVVVRKVTESATAAITASALALLFFYGLWFGYTIYRRSRKEQGQFAS
jgi:DMSO reductase anchor subunit